MKYIKKMLTISFFILSMLLFANRVDAAEEKIVITYKDDEKIHGYIEKTIEKQEVLSINKSIFNAELITNADINMQYANQYYYNQLTNEIARITYNTLKTDNIITGYLYFYIHMITEIICFFSLSRIINNSILLWTIPFVYDAFAFVPQSLIGYFSDKKNRR